jgi:site-specific recombinase
MICPVISAEQIAAAFAEGDRRQRRVRELATLMEALAAASELRARTDALVALVQWMLQPDRRVPLPATGVEHAAGPANPSAIEPMADIRRLEVVIRLLEHKAVGAAIRRQVGALLAECEGVRLFAETGLGNDRGLLSETTDRLFARLLPTPRDDHDLYRLLFRLFPSKRDLAYLDRIPPGSFARLYQALLGPTDEFPGAPREAPLFTRLQAAVTDAWVLVSARLQGLGLSQAIRERSRPQPLPESPFYRLPRASDRVLAQLDDPTARAEAARAWREAADGCRQELKVVLNKLEAAGISLDVVYTLEVIEQALRRMEHLLAYLVARPGPERAAAVHRLVFILTRARLHDRSLRALVYTNMHLLARKLVERAGRTGEHYITATRREYWQMLASGAGGGLVTLGTLALKFEISMLFLPLFMEGLLSGINYAASFILIQVLGFTLATKQPSMTAATLAESIGESAGPERLNDLVGQAARIVRSQLCAAMGNVLTVTLAALALESVWRHRTGVSYLDPERAEYVVRSLHPLKSGMIWYAALTGVILWSSSLVGGWVENFAVYRRLPQAIAEHRAGRLTGRRFLRWFGEAFSRNVSGWAGSIALGLMLGMTPVLGKFFGLPLDVRHVTLSSGTLALALAEQSAPSLRSPAALAAIGGIGIIFVLNLGVSFFLAMTVALRAKEVPRRDRWALLRAIVRRFVQRPGEFLFPPRNHQEKPTGVV